jgi:hypothetical protein
VVTGQEFRYLFFIWHVIGLILLFLDEVTPFRHISLTHGWRQMFFLASSFLISRHNFQHLCMEFRKGASSTLLLLVHQPAKHVLRY